MTPSLSVSSISWSHLAILLATSITAVGCDEEGYGLDREFSEILNLWCGEMPCSWELESGAIEPVPTWHEVEPGIGFLEVPTVISTYLISPRNACWGFELSADVEPGTRFVLETDYLDDGQAESQRVIAVQDFDLVTVGVSNPVPSLPVRLRLRLETPGRAHLARIYSLEMTNSTFCKGQTPPEILNRPDGVVCESNEQCQSGRCQCRGGDASWCIAQCIPR